jgi:hypothetical protein
MKNDTLQGMSEVLGGLPVLEQRKVRLIERIKTSKEQLKILKDTYDSKASKVLKNEGEGLASAFRSFIRKYNGKIDKNIQDMLTAKQDFEKEKVHLKDLDAQNRELDVRIGCLMQNKESFEEELVRREKDIAGNQNHDLYDAYVRIQKESTEAARQLVENEEALIVARRVMATANTSLEELEKAEDWVSSDMWGGSGLVGRTTKFSKMDHAQSTFNRLASQLRDLEREVGDVNLDKSIFITTITSTERMVEFWFDNILAGRDITSLLRSNQAQIKALIHQVGLLIDVLTKNDLEKKEQLDLLEKEKSALITTCQSCQTEDGDLASCSLR